MLKAISSSNRYDCTAGHLLRMSKKDISPADVFCLGLMVESIEKMASKRAVVVRAMKKYQHKALEAKAIACDERLKLLDSSIDNTLQNLGQIVGMDLAHLWFSSLDQTYSDRYVTDMWCQQGLMGYLP